jgi:cytochrome c peroxidase
VFEGRPRHIAGADADSGDDAEFSINEISTGMRDGIRMKAAIAWKTGGIVALGLLLLWTGMSISRNAPPFQTERRDAFRRPAEIPHPESNPHSVAKAALGRTLFFDPVLSGSQTRSCATCHNPALSWGDGLPRAIGEKQAVLPLRSPTLIAVAWMPRLGWDGKFRDIEAVTFGPITSKTNMNLPEPELLARLSAIPGYVRAFNAAFGEGDITRRKIELALATYQRSIVPEQSPFDRWLEGDEAAISAAAKRGFDVFKGKAKCTGCHNGFALSDGSFHDIGTGKDADIGRGRMFPNSVPLRYAFKTPTLRDVTRRAPYMHDGSVPTLEAVIDLYDRGGIDRPSRSKLIFPLGLTGGEKSDLIAFLETLTAEPAPFKVPTLPR